MYDMLFSRLLQTFLQDPKASIELPIEYNQRESFLEDGKKTISNSLQICDEASARSCLRFAWIVYRQEKTPLYYAWASWCTAAYLRDQKPNTSARHLKNALLYYQSIGDTEKESRVLVGYGGLLGQLDEFAEAEAALTRADELLPADSPNRVFVYLNLSDIYWRTGQYQKMQANAQRSMDEALRKEETYDYIEASINYAISLMKLSNISEADECLRDVYEKAALEGASELLGKIQLNRGYIAVGQGRLREALHFFNEASACFREAGMDIDVETTSIEQRALSKVLSLPEEGD
jgi:tetratricopeptide (TPR) repeat protein